MPFIEHAHKSFAASTRQSIFIEFMMLSLRNSLFFRNWSTLFEFFLGGFQLLNQKCFQRSRLNASTCITQNSQKGTTKHDNNLLA